MKYKISAFIITLCILAGLAAPSSACADDSALSLNQTKLTLYVGNTYQLYLSNAESEEYGYYFYYYQCEWSTSITTGKGIETLSTDEKYLLLNNCELTIDFPESDDKIVTHYRTGTSKY